MALLAGAFAGAWISHQFQPRIVDVRRDTLFIYDTVRIMPEEMETEQIEGKAEYVDIPVPEETPVPGKPDTVWVEKYITLPRLYYHTTMKDAEVWHSGIDSRIDSLYIFQEKQVITNTIIQSPPDFRFRAYFGADCVWANNWHIAPNIGAEIGYKRLNINAQLGACIGSTGKITPYMSTGVRYDISHR